MARKSRTERQKISKESVQKAKRIFKYMRPYRGTFIIGWFALLISSMTSLGFPVFMGQLLGSGGDQPGSMSEVFQKLSMDTVNTFAFGLLILFIVQALFAYIRVVTFTYVTENTLRDVRKDAFSRLIYMPLDFFNKNKVGELTSRMSSDITQIQEVLRTTIAEFFRQIVMIVGGITLLFVFSWKLSLIMLATIPVMALSAVLFGRFIKRLSIKAQDKAASSNTIIEEALMGITNVKAFTNEIFTINRYSSDVDEIRELNIKSGLWRGVFVSFMIFFVFGAIVFIIWQGLLMTQGVNPELPQQDFFSFIMITVMMGASFGALPDMYSNIQKAIGATENFMTIIQQDGERELHRGEQKPEITGQVTFENVHFSYPQRKDITVLNGINLSIDKNQTVALVGSSGAGKSTIASLLLKYYDINQGSIKFDGINTLDIDTEHLRSHMAIVPQEVILFAGTISENIAFGNPDASEEKIIEAAKKANAWEFISTFPDGMNTQVGDRGIQLSGGQKQRIAIARAILKNPTILILDEATSALDSESEKLVQDALNRLMEGRTSVVIAHRLSTIRSADCIYVLDNGKVAESGNHTHLLSQNGIYANLVKISEATPVQND